jgi:catechol 2,3-dioxygenase-like lactoylglutathione lyase family enzyme
MKAETTLNHIALECSDKGGAEIFFTKILGMQKAKSFTLSEDLADLIFGIKRSVEVDVYDNGMSRIEVFITGSSKEAGYEHTCIEIRDKKGFVADCRKYDIEPIVIKKEGKDLLFVKDFSNNLFEVKEKQLL